MSNQLSIVWNDVKNLVDENTIDLSNLSTFEKDILKSILQVGINDIIESRRIIHNDIDQRVEFNDLSDDEKKLAVKHLYA